MIVNPPISRRQALKIVAVASALPLAAYITKSQATTYTWRGRALGVEAEMQFVHHDEAFLKRIINQCVSEIDRLEDIFSLYRPGSEINRLNDQGYLTHVSPELRTVLAEAHTISLLSQGAFDITVQPLWTRRDKALEGINFRNIELSGHGVRFLEKHMAITLNGIAQGYITDRVADLLRGHGFDHLLLQLGETQASAPIDQPWQIALNNRSGKKISLTSGAIATSSGNHIVDPESGDTPRHYLSVSVIAPSAMTADALSTALFVADPSQAERIINRSAAKLAVIEQASGESKVIG
ncbi:MAG: FAD:protein FMN transferase [Rhodospirillaceae bacterium]|jgi:FAD:protein FMN transferase|nr:FAD:protein FMN transferase [Rhodospirillaceae bacterium]MBT4940594.1 FAD:protein FMN transferase [Rhodospirillaceae bacterium]MBT5941943.1 FAD:protein FMN transferase [Rhodospirillaceae bacterium]MBT7268348.1 FAD:protein FMN transferase [Rhodospirillaceae bacterium]